MRRNLHLVIYTLLLALFCGLGDGPFVDEVIGDEQQDSQVQLVQAPAGDEAPHPTALVLVYTTLMNGAVNDLSATRAISRAAAQPLPAYSASLYAPPQLSPPDEPPRPPV